MRALVFTAPSEVKLLEVPDPVPGENEVVIDVRVAGICGSDVHGVVSPGFRVPPLILGHELAGELDGQRVAVNPLLTCGRCQACASGATFLCPDRTLIGVHRPGGLAARVAVPTSALVPLSEHLDWRSASAVEPTANVVHALRLGSADLSSSSRVAVLGAGAIGLLTLQLLRQHGVADVTVIDVAKPRLTVARALGATDTELTGQYDVTIDAAGTGASRTSAVTHLRPGGLSVWLGLADQQAGFEATDLVRQAKRITGCFAYTHDDFRAGAEKVRDLDLSWVDLVPLSSAASEFEDLLARRSQRIKVVFTTDERDA